MRILNSSTSFAVRESGKVDSEMTIAAVVVTFNRKALLAECLDALLQQTRPLDMILVIDQASSDGTAEMLQQKGYRDLDQICYLRSEVNSGGAGGFHRGVESAFLGGFDWIWIMDDDAIAHPDALQQMIQWTAEPGVAAIANSKIRLDGTLDEGHLERTGARLQNGGPALLSFSSFVGLMIHRRVVEKIGFPKAELFLQGDDTEYCRRLHRAGHIVFAEDAVLVHKEVRRPIATVQRFGRPFTIYPTDQFCFHFYFLWRNRIWIETHDQGLRPARIFWLGRKMFRMLLRTCVIDRQDLGLRIGILLKAFKDGLLGKFDNEFPFRMRELSRRSERQRG